MNQDPKQEIMDFWNDFDNTFHFRISPSIDKYYDAIFPPSPTIPHDFDRPIRQWLYHRRNQSYPDGFKKEIVSIKPELIGLANEQMRFFNDALHRDSDLIQKAFEDFGQGILYDDRRALKLHKMDGDPPALLVGYFRWHVFIQALLLLSEFDKLWYQIDQYVGLAWAIQLIAPIKEQDPNNPGLKDEKLAELRTRWLSMSSQQLDDEFETGFSTGFK